MVPAPRAPVPLSRQQPHGLAPAAGQPAVGRSGRDLLGGGARSAGAARPLARQAPAPGSGRSDAGARLARRPGQGSGAHGAVRRAPRRPGARLPASHPPPGGLAGPDRLGGGRRQGDRHQGGAGRLPRPPRPPPADLRHHSRPGRDRGQHPSFGQLDRNRPQHRDPLRGGPPDGPARREVPDRRSPHRHRRRQPRGDGRRRPVRLALPAPPRRAAQHDPVVAGAPVPFVRVLGALRGAHQPGAAPGRGPPRRRAPAGNGAARDPRGRLLPPVAGGPGVPQPAHRRQRQHPPRRVLHRQALQPRLQHRTVGPLGAARLRDAAAPADVVGAAAVHPGPGGPLLGEALPHQATAPRHGPAGPLRPAAPVVGRPGRCGLGTQPGRHPLRGRLVPAAP